MSARGSRWWQLGLVLGLLGWLHLVSWVFVAAALLIAPLLRTGGDRNWRRLGSAIGLSVLICAPLALHRARAEGLLGSAPAATLLRGNEAPISALAHPHLVTLDLGVLALLGIGGLIVMRVRRSCWDATLLAAAASAWGLWLVSSTVTPAAVSPAPETVHYLVRLSLALAAGVALAAGARMLERHRGLSAGRGHVAVMAVLLPLTFPAHWNPPTMDRLYEPSLKPIPPKVLDYARWIRENTPRDAVFAAGPTASTWIPALTGRRVLLTGTVRPPADYYARKGAEWVLMTGTDLARLHEAAAAFGVTHLAADKELMHDYGFEWFKRPDVYETLYRSSALKIMSLRRERLGPPRDPWDRRPLQRQPR
jgi:hypothetical protein